MRSLKGVSLSRIIGTAARAFFPAASHMAQESTGGNHRRSLDAATGGRRGGGLGTFGPINSEVAAGQSLVGSRAAYQAVNNPYIANAVTNLVTALVGTGQRPNVRGVERELRRQMHFAFDRFCETADHAGRTDFGGLLAQIARDMVVYGEGLAVMHDTADGLQIQVIPPVHLDPAKTEILRDGRQIVQGVEFDASGRRVKSDTQGRFGVGATNSRFTLSSGHGCAVSGFVVMTFPPRTTPWISMAFISRSTVQRAISFLSRQSACQTLRAP